MEFEVPEKKVKTTLAIHIKKLRSIVLMSTLLLFASCEDRLMNNPYDTRCSGDLFSPSNLVASIVGDSVMIAWEQTNRNIDGFIINKSENYGLSEVMDSLSKMASVWYDSNITPGLIYEYELMAFAGKNLSDVQTVSLTPLFKPTVATSSASDIDTSSAVLGGYVSEDGGLTVTDRGICYSLENNPDTTDTKIKIGSGKGSFSKIVTGFIKDSTYYVKAYATNSKGTVYGEEIFFTAGLNLTVPVLTTSEARDITSASALLGGYVVSDGGSVVTERGICSSLSESPAIEDNKTIMGSGTGTFSGTVTGFQTEQLYYVRAYAINTIGVAYGQQISFTATTETTIASVTTAEPAAISSTGATLGGNVLSDGGADVTERGIVYNTAGAPYLYSSGSTANCTKATVGSGTGSFSRTVNELSSNKKYYVRAYAINSKGIAYGNELTFTTLYVLPSVETGDITAITPVAANIQGYVSSAGSSSVSEKGFCWGTQQAPSITGNHEDVGSGTGSFDLTINKIVPNTCYYVRAYATNSSGISYGSEKNFTTTDSYYEGFESGFPSTWTSKGWGVTSTVLYDTPYEGSYCLEATQANDSIYFTKTITTAPNGIIQFYCYTYYTDLTFYIDDVAQAVLSGDSWTLHSYTVPAGTHAFKWKVTEKYSKTYIDYIIVSP